MNKHIDKATPHPKNIGGKHRLERQPADDQEPAGLDAEGKPFYRRKAAAIEGPRAGTSNRSQRGGRGGRFDP